MKNKTKFIITFGIILAFAVGFLAGITTEYPKPKNTEGLAGTIAKVKKFNNTKATEEDIKLRDELIKDSSKLEAVKQLVTYQYANSISRKELIDNAIEAAKEDTEFYSNNSFTIDELEKYSEYLENSRMELLITIAALEKAKENNPVVTRNTLNQAINIITQTKYRNTSVLEFTEKLYTYINNNSESVSQELRDSFNSLATNEFRDAILTRNTTAAKSLAQYNIKPDGSSLNLIESTKSVANSDLEKLAMVSGTFDSEKLGFYVDSETLNTGFTDRLSAIMIILDTEKFGVFYDSDNLSAFMADKTLGSSTNPNWDSEKLGTIWDSEKLSMGHGWWDSETLSLLVLLN
jgi:hypothetical protein